MLKANNVDHDKLVSVIKRIIIAGRAEHVKSVNESEYPEGVRELRFIAVDQNEFYQACGFSRLRKTDFTAEVQDTLTHASFCREFGAWLYTEFEHDQWVFVFLGLDYKGKLSQHLSNTGELVEIAVPTTDIVESEEPGWYISATGTLKPHDHDDENQVVDGSTITVKGTYGTYSTRLYALKSEARKARTLARMIENDSDEDDDF